VRAVDDVETQAHDAREHRGERPATRDGLRSP